MQYHILKLISAFICCLPHSFLLAFGKWVGEFYFCFIKKQRNRAVAQMSLSLHLRQEEAEKLVRDSFINMGRNFFEMMYMPHLTKQNFRKYIDIDNLSRLQAALAENHGVVILTGHVGNWEWLSAAFTFSDLPVTAIAKPQPNEQHTHFLNYLRQCIGVEIFSRGTSELLAAARSLKKGKILGFLADQDAGPGGAFLDFFGRRASTPMGPAVFAKKFHSPIVPAFILRQPDGRHKVIIGEIMRYEDHGDSDKDLFELTARMTKILENVIRDNPTQWLWFQKRWNTPPDEQKTRHHTIKPEEESHE